MLPKLAEDRKKGWLHVKAILNALEGFRYRQRVVELAENRYGRDGVEETLGCGVEGTFYVWVRVQHRRAYLSVSNERDTNAFVFTKRH